AAAVLAAPVAPGAPGAPAEYTRIESSRPTKVAKLVRSAKAAAAEPDQDETGSRLPRRAFLQVALGALLVAVVIVAAPRVSGVVSWGQQLFAKGAPTAVGTVVPVEANQLHPAGQVLAGSPVPARPTAGRVAKGQELVAVPLRISNAGLARWDLALAKRVTVIDTLGVSHAVDTSIPGVKGLELLPAKLRLAPGQSTTGYAVFSLPSGRTIRSVQLGLSASADDTVTWQVRP
ncbi:MAG TPA: hypothetical protein VF416_07045, partial [Marmoricola sp.]